MNRLLLILQVLILGVPIVIPLFLIIKNRMNKKPSPVKWEAPEVPI